MMSNQQCALKFLLFIAVDTSQATQLWQQTRYAVRFFSRQRITHTQYSNLSRLLRYHRQHSCYCIPAIITL